MTFVVYRLRISIKENKTVPLLVDILNCEHGCTLGTGTDKDLSLDDVNYEMNQLKYQKIKEQKTFNLFKMKKTYKLFDYFDKTLNLQDFTRHYSDKSHLVKRTEITTKDIKNVFNQLHKETDASRGINCFACGYGNCEKFAKAIVNNENVLDSCIYYNKKELEEKSLMTQETLNHLKNILTNSADFSTQLKDSLHQLANGAQNQASEIISSSSEATDIKNLSFNMLESFKTVIEAISETTKNVNIGKEYIQNTLQNIHNSRDNVGTISNQIVHLETKSKEIEKVIDIISSISTQTNLLAINATIEAVNANQYGKGFAVVANEVKILAEKTSNATQQVSDIIKEIKKETEIAVKEAKKAVLAVENGVKSVQNVKTQFDHIYSNADNSLAKADIITASLNQLNDKNNNISNALENLSAISQEFTALFEEISNSLEVQNDIIREETQSFL